MRICERATATHSPASHPHQRTLADARRYTHSALELRATRYRLRALARALASDPSESICEISNRAANGGAARAAVTFLSLFGGDFPTVTRDLRFSAILFAIKLVYWESRAKRHPRRPRRIPRFAHSIKTSPRAFNQSFYPFKPKKWRCVIRRTFFPRTIPWSPILLSRIFQMLDVDLFRSRFIPVQRTFQMLLTKETFSRKFITLANTVALLLPLHFK